MRAAALVAAVALAALVVAAPCGAQQPSVKYVWNQLIAFGDWHNASCWLPEGVPGPDDIAVISGSWNITVNITQSVGVQSFEVGRGSTLNVGEASTLKFTQPSYVDAGGALSVGPGCALVFARLDVRGSLDVLSASRAQPTVVAGLLPPRNAANGVVTPTSELNVYADTQLLGMPATSWINISNVVISNYGHLHLGGIGATFLQIWLLDYTVINNTVGAVFDVEQPPTGSQPYFYYVLAGWLSRPRIINSGRWALGGIHVSQVDLEEHGVLTVLDQAAMIDGYVLTGSKFLWNLTTPNAGVVCSGYAVNVQEWKIIGPGGIQFMMLGIGMQGYTRFVSGRLEAHTDVDFVGVKFNSTFDFSIPHGVSVRMRGYNAYNYADVTATVLDGMHLVNHGTLLLDADGSTGTGDVAWLNNGATIVNEVDGVLTFKATWRNFTVRSTEGATGSIVNRGVVNVTYGYGWANPPLQVPLHSNGTLYVSGNFTTGAGLYITSPRLGNVDVKLGPSARLAFAAGSQCVVDVCTVDSVYNQTPGVFGQLDESNLQIGMFLFLRAGTKFEWYGGNIAGPGQLAVLPGSSVTTQFPATGLTHTPQFNARLGNQGIFHVRGPFVAGDGADFINQGGTIDVQTKGSILFTPNCTWRNLPGSVWAYQTRVHPGGTTVVCPSCWNV